MLKDLHTLSPYLDFIHACSADPDYRDPMLLTEQQLHRNLLDAPENPNTRVLGTFENDTVTGVFALLALLKLFAAPLKLTGKLLVNTLLGFALLGILSALGVLAKLSLGLNLFNSESLLFWKELGLESAAVSMELRWQQLRDLRKVLPCEAVVYGRLPLMIMENCVIRNELGCRDAGRDLSLIHI